MGSDHDRERFTRASWLDRPVPVRRLGWVRDALLLVLPLAALLSAVVYDMPFEDSYISFRYAENLAAGMGIVYNAGEVVEGFTSFGWVVLLAMLKSAGLPIPAVATFLSLGFGLGVVVMTAALSQAWLGARGAWRVGPAILVLVNGTWAYYSGTGMETTLFVLLLTLALVLLARGDFAAAAWAGVVMAGASLVRPEGVGYVAVLLAALLFDRDGRKQALVMLAVFLLVFGPYFAWRWSHFGHPLPNTWYAKASPGVAGFTVGLVQVEEFFTTQLFWVVPAALAVCWVLKGAERWSRLAAAVVVGAVVNVVLVGGDGFAFHRFFLPAIPAGAVAIVGAGRALMGVRRIAGLRGRISPRFVGGLLFVLLCVWTFHAPLRSRTSFTAQRPESQYERVMSVREINDEYFVVGAWLRENFSPETLVATNAAGIVPYVSGLPTIDMLGLNDVHIAHRDITLGKVTLGHEKHDALYVLSRKPDVILLGLPVITDTDIRSSELEIWFSGWWQYLPGDRDMFLDESFRRDYVPYSVKVTETEWLTFFLRRPE
ncbi:MAG: hypothetical protein JRG91_16165 [Deltaproteobacteria bacterium]|nr:hypothetical protein [Deltaproteobacteria bacterium]